jgi:hypothetical protein
MPPLAIVSLARSLEGSISFQYGRSLHVEHRIPSAILNISQADVRGSMRHASATCAISFLDYHHILLLLYHLSVIHCPLSIFHLPWTPHSSFFYLPSTMQRVSRLAAAHAFHDASSTPISSSFFSSIPHSPMPRCAHGPLALHDVLFSHQPPSRPTISTQQRLPLHLQSPVCPALKSGDAVGVIGMATVFVIPPLHSRSRMCRWRIHRFLRTLHHLLLNHPAFI